MNNMNNVRSRVHYRYQLINDMTRVLISYALITLFFFIRTP